MPMVSFASPPIVISQITLMPSSMETQLILSLKKQGKKNDSPDLMKPRNLGKIGSAKESFT
jgi:hypothetical protein